MTPDIKELVKQLRALSKAEWLIGYGADGNVYSATLALETLAGEVEKWKQEAAWDKAAASDFLGRAEEAEAERDRLKAALAPFAAIKADDGDTFDTWHDDVIIRCEITVRDLKQARVALGDAS